MSQLALVLSGFGSSVDYLDIVFIRVLLLAIVATVVDFVLAELFVVHLAAAITYTQLLAQALDFSAQTFDHLIFALLFIGRCLFSKLAAVLLQRPFVLWGWLPPRRCCV